MKNIAYIFLESEGVEICIKEKGNIEKIFVQYFPLNFKKNKKASSNEISQLICDKIFHIEEKYKIYELVFVFQDENIIFKEINVENIIRKKEIKEFLDSDITQYGIGIIDDYEITYNRYLKKEKDSKKIRVCLFPKVNIEIAEKVSLNTKKKCKKIYSKHEIIEKLIKSNKGRKDVLEFRNSDIVLYVVENNKTESTMTIKNEGVDNEFLQYIAETNLSVIENANIESIDTSINIMNSRGNIEIIPKEKIFNVIDKSKSITNYVERTSSRKSLKRIVKIMCIILVVSVLYSSRYFVENKSLKNRLESTINEKKISVNTERVEHIKGYKHIYGVDTKIVEDTISKNPKEIQSINAEKGILEVELVTRNINEINKIISNPLYKKVNVEYIKSEEIDSEEAQQAYWIGDSIVKIITESFKSYAEEELIEELENNEGDENGGLNGGYVENSDKFKENKQENKNNNPQKVEKSNLKKTEDNEKSSNKSEKIKVYFIKIRAVI